MSLKSRALDLPDDDQGTVWIKDLGRHTQMGVLDSEALSVNSQTLFSFETAGYAVLTREEWLDEDGWEMIGTL